MTTKERNHKNISILKESSASFLFAPVINFAFAHCCLDFQKVLQ